MNPRLLLLLILLPAVAPMAAAHGAIERSSPGPGERTLDAPGEVWIEFNEPVDARSTHIRVYGPNETRVDNDDVSLQSPRRARVTLQPDLPEAGYLVQWETLSVVDGHPTRGSFGFATGNATPPQTGLYRPPPLPILSVIGKAAAYTGLALACGVAAMRIALRANPIGLNRQAQLGGSLHLLGLLILWLDSASLASQEPLAFLQDTEFGNSLRLRLLLALLLVGLTFLPPRIDRSFRGPALAALCLPLIALYAGNGHVAAFAPYGLGTLLDALHLGAALTWSGGLVGLLLVLHQAELDPPAATTATQRFGRLAMACALTVVVSGLLMTVVVLGTEFSEWPLYLGSAYGLSLLYKVLLAAAMITIGALNHYAHGRRIETAPLGNLFRLSVRREAITALLIFLLAGALTNLSPALPLNDDKAPPLVLELDGGRLRFNLTIDPPPDTRNASRFELLLLDIPSGRPVDAAFLARITFRSPDPELGSFLDLRSIGGGRYRGHAAPFLIPGAWNLTVAAETATVAHDEATFRVTIA